MKPNFALGLTKDGITLWQRSASGWLRVGAVSPEAPQMDAQMRDLAKVAAALAPEGVRTKLVVPDEQILFCDLQISARNPDMQAHEIRAQLAGRTPYPVEELDFDWTEKNGTAHVAVVARETVIEAEDFASLYGLNPVSIVGASENGRFTQEPFFGTTRRAREILGDPDSLERDRDILRESGIVTLPDPELVVAEKAPRPPQDAGNPETPPIAPADKAAKPAQAPPEKGPVPQSEPSKDTVTRGSAAVAPPVPATPTPTSVVATTSAADDRKAAMMSKLKAAKADSDNAALRNTSDSRTTAFSTGQGSSTLPGSTATSPPQPKEDTSAEAVAFRSRRAATPAAGPVKTPTANVSAPKPGKDLLGALRSRLGSRPRLSKLSFGAFGKALGTPKGNTTPPNATASPAPDSNRAIPWKPDTKATATKPPAPKPAVAPAALQKPVPKPASGKPDLTKAANASAKERKGPLDTLRKHGTSGSGQSEVERMTIFGARNRDDEEASPTRRAFLVLGGVALLLVAVAIWVFYFTASDPETSGGVAGDFSPVVDPAPLVTEQADPMDSVGAQDEIEAALGLEDAAQQLPIDSTGLDLADESEASPQVTANPTAENEATAGRVAGLRSNALLPPQEAVPLPAPPSAPAPFGAEPLPPLREELEIAATPSPDEAAGGIAADTLTLDDATPDASGLPAGEDALDIAVTPGTPPVTPPTRPEGLAPEPEPVVTPEAALDPEPELAVTEEAALDPLDESSLVITVTEGRPSVTPPARPAALTPEVPAASEPVTEGEPDTQIQPLPEGAEESSSADQAQSNTPPPGGVALTALRPATRPAELAEAAAAAVAMPDFDASELAVAASLRPGARPGQFAAVVQRALRAAQPRTTTQAPATVAEAPAPQAQAAVQTARAAVPAAPPIPASASVAREATQARAINLRQINLIGVMGTSSSRRALVRLSNGRVVAVRVGEQLDGGQVTAIGENELRYIRRGRDVVLRIAS